MQRDVTIGDTHSTGGDSFRHLASQWISGVAIVTTRDRAGAPFGITVTAVTSLSLSPPQFLVCLDNRSRTLQAILASGHFCINYLSSGQSELATNFARSAHDKFRGIKLLQCSTRSPVLDGVIAYVDCGVNSTHPGGDHNILVGLVERMAVFGGDPLGYFRGAYRRLAP